jgi:3-hydroxyacyl-CoA dehydrogenase/enoyl-CoA hydratase/3-hydroxybutyryl-CoA epimerase
VFELRFDPPGTSPRFATLVLDVTSSGHGREDNALHPDLVPLAESALTAFLAEPGIVAGILVSGRSDVFADGIDLEALTAVRRRVDVENLLARLAGLMQRLAASQRPIIAAIDGRCAGAGFELALACRGRVASDAPRTRFGCPDVRLGLIPALGGLSRLPRLAGLSPSLEIVMRGRMMDARRAGELGLVDRVVPAEELPAAARERALELALSSSPTVLSSILASRSPRGIVSAIGEAASLPDVARSARYEVERLGKTLLCAQARAAVMRRDRGLYAAPLVAIDIMERGMGLPVADGLSLAASAMSELAVGETSRALVHLARDGKDAAAELPEGIDVLPPVRQMGVVGGGFIGSEVAALASERGVDARIAEPSAADLSSALERVARHFERRGRPRTTPTSSLRVGVGTWGFEALDLVLEAVPEDLALKQRIFAELDERCAEHTVLATNTLTLSVRAIASATRHRDRVVGLHFFAPVDRMPLVEIVRTPETSPLAVATCRAFARRLGKIPIVVADTPPFFASRVLGTYLVAAIELVARGYDVVALDDGARAVGWQSGPFELMDWLGLDVGLLMTRALPAVREGRVKLHAALASLVAAGHVGRRSRRGFYLHDAQGHRRPDPRIPELFPERASRVARTSPDELGDRLTLVAAAEAIRCLDEAVITSPRDGNVAAVYGLGYPALRGGPFHHVEMLGLREVVERMNKLTDRFGSTFAPPPGLLDRAAHGRGFDRTASSDRASSTSGSFEAVE